jgi:ribose/xylose/arabinose/galactoside ABC-type transport system permease subunit
MITLALITNILNLLSIAAAAQLMIKGCIIVLAVLMSNAISRRKNESV